MLTRQDLERELRTKISADSKSIEARYRDDCAGVRERIQECLEMIEDEIDDASLDVLEDILRSVEEAVYSFGVPAMTREFNNALRDRND